MALTGGKQRRKRDEPGLVDRIGPYEVLHEIGRGGMGVVFLARQPSLNRLVAVKVLLTDNAELAQRMRREADVLAELQHPNIVTIHDVGEVGRKPYLAMAYCAGGSLSQALREQGRLTPGQAATALSAVAEALAALHAKGLVHRDVKPSNILLSGDGDPYLGDLGLAAGGDAPSITTSGSLLGTIGYTAPELLDGHDASPASDVFALGVLGYQLLSGRLPFAGQHVAAVIDACRRGDRPPLGQLATDAPPALVDLVESALATDPAQRPADLRWWAASVRSTVALTPITPAAAEEQDTAGTNAGGWPSREVALTAARAGGRRRALAVVAIAAVALVVAAVVFTRDDGQNVATRPSPTTASTEAAAPVVREQAAVTRADGSVAQRTYSLGDDGNFVATLRFDNPTAAALVITHDEVIPESIANNVSELTFDPVFQQVMVADPVVRYVVEVPAGESVELTYTRSVEPPEDPEAQLIQYETDQSTAQQAYELSLQGTSTTSSTLPGSTTSTTRRPTTTSSSTTSSSTTSSSTTSSSTTSMTEPCTNDPFGQLPPCD